MDPLLPKINNPGDLKELSSEELCHLANELRTLIIETVSETGGHLAPNLGAVELTIALHTVFNTPVDKIVWDVGHQAYTHKILTGRKDRFHTLRQYGGISGFPKISESEFDDFGVGHSSTAISAALGIAAARDMSGKDFSVVAVVGDGALSGGIAFEGLNNAGGSRKNMVVVLNDNRMSISPNVGALSRYLTHIITAPLYNKLKNDVWWLTGKLPRGTTRVRETVQRIEEGLKAMVVPGLLFERLGFRYIGPADGHDLPNLLKIFKEIKRMHGPILVHLITTKGKGYKYAEEDATRFHGLGSFCPETGKSQAKKAASYSEVFGRALDELARKDDKIVGITAAMADGTGLIHFAKNHQDRFYDVGIAEQHAVTFAAGMALHGYKPVVAIYSTFMQRAYDQVIHDVALQKIPVVLVMDRAGLVGEDGPTHHGSFDLSFMRIVPNLVILAPRNADELRNMLYSALQYKDGPVAIRFPRGESQGNINPGFKKIPIGKSEKIREGSDVALLAVGDMVQHAVCVSDALETKNVSAAVIDVRSIKPFDTAMLKAVCRKFSFVFTLENNSIIGGVGSIVAEHIAESGSGNVVFRRFGLPDRFVTHGKMTDLIKEIELDIDDIARAVLKMRKKAKE